MTRRTPLFYDSEDDSTYVPDSDPEEDDDDVPELGPPRLEPDDDSTASLDEDDFSFDDDDEDDQDKVRANEEAVDEPVPEPPRRTGRAQKPRDRLAPSWTGQSYEVNHLVTQVNPEETIEYTLEEAPVLARFFEKTFAVTYSLKKGIAKFGKRGEEAVDGEMKQLHNQATWKASGYEYVECKRTS